MTYSSRRYLKSLSLILAAFLFGHIQGAYAASQVEGRIGTSNKTNGLFDLRVEIWNRTSEVPQLLQVIDIPRVRVSEGCFNVTLETGIRPESIKDFSMTIQSRGFESWKPFMPAELSKFQST